MTDDGFGVALDGRPTGSVRQIRDHERTCCHEQGEPSHEVRHDVIVAKVDKSPENGELTSTSSGIRYDSSAPDDLANSLPARGVEVGRRVGARERDPDPQSRSSCRLSRGRTPGRWGSGRPPRGRQISQAASGSRPGSPHGRIEPRACSTSRSAHDS